MKKSFYRLLSALLIFFISPAANAQGAKAPSAIPIQKIIHLAAAKYSAYIATCSASDAAAATLRYPRTLKPDGTLVATDAADWTSGFFPGCLWYLYRFTHDAQYIEAAQEWTAGLAAQQFNTHTHDLGFMLYDSYGQGYAVTKSKTYRSILLQGARSLSTRFHPNVGAIRSWDNPEFNYPVIIDNLMNLEYLFWATKASGDSSFYKIALAHANTDLRYRFRPDNSSYHVLDFDSTTGKLLRRMTHQGYSDSSCWARGQAWGIYGYTVLYRETRDPRFLKRAILTADYFLKHTDKIPDHIPYWDFQAPDIPNAPRDASAAAVAASALFELSAYAGPHYREKAIQLLKALCSPRYLAPAGSTDCFLLRHSTGHKPHNSEIDVPLIYADYYFLEALWRYNEPPGAMATSETSRRPKSAIAGITPPAPSTPAQ